MQKDTGTIPGRVQEKGAWRPVYTGPTVMNVSQKSQKHCLLPCTKNKKPHSRNP